MAEIHTGPAAGPQGRPCHGRPPAGTEVARHRFLVKLAGLTRITCFTLTVATTVRTCQSGLLPVDCALRAAIGPLNRARAHTQRGLEGDFVQLAGGHVEDEPAQRGVLLGDERVASMRRSDWRTSSTSAKDSAAHSGFDAGLGLMSRLKSSSVNAMPQSVWWIRDDPRVPSSRWLDGQERISSSVTTPPALRMTCAHHL